MENISFFLPDDIKSHYILSFLHGSCVYGTNSERSDMDVIVIVDDNYNLSEYPNNIMEYRNDKYDFQIINNHTFIDMMRNHHIIAVESLFMNADSYSDKWLFNCAYTKHFTLNLWKLRQVISSIVNNSYAKCHKKLTVPEDFNLYTAQKSIFHCIRLYMFGIQIASKGRIYDYSEANRFLSDILSMGSNWQEYKEKFKPVINHLRTEFVKLCPKNT